MQIYRSKAVLQNIPNNLRSSRYNYVATNKEKRYKTRKLLGFSIHEIYEVVADIKNYDKFLPFCTKATILKQKPSECQANLEIGFPPLVENYTSVVKLIKSNLVRSECFDGKLFDYLESTWVFNPALQSNPKTCITDYSIKFSFKSEFHSYVMSLFFEKLVKEMETAFINETVRRYGKPSLPCHILTPSTVTQI